MIQNIPEISIIIPLYNSEKYISECIESIQNQTFSNFEVIIINDGSTDQSFSICQALIKNDKRFRLINQKNKGVSMSRNKGIKLSRGNFIAFIDDDDLIYPKYIEVLYRAIKSSNSDVSICLSKKYFGDKKVELINKPISFECISSRKLTQLLFINLPENFSYTSVWGKLYKKEIIRGILFKNTIHEDIEFNYRIYKNIKEAAFLPEPLYLWRQHPNSLHRNRKPHELYSIVKCYISILNKIPQDDKLIKGECLKRIFKAFLSVRYDLNKIKTKYNEKSIVLNQIRKDFIYYKKDFMQSNVPSLKFKIIIFLFFYLKILYNIYRYIMAFKTRHSI